MKLCLIALCLAVATCIDAQGFPTAKCPPGEHSVLYCPERAEPDCDNPTVHDLKGPAACGRPQCFCNTPNVRNLKTGKCIPLSKC
ncbi:unnamed protein product [Pieris macdunnoughi]|uniref:Uncharacterized protein n=1 Tax=Pieris macdunnoughi TaxID=345717 RepID=A0A821T8G8_9NEOP|nr:unnamed protein product [Pieris macdunnoughi]